MAFEPINILQYANRESILGGSTTKELIEFIQDQIHFPFTANNSNYFKQLKENITDKDQLDELCATFCTGIQDNYPGLVIDLSDYEKHLTSLFASIYKFFIKDAIKMMYLFIREFVFNNKNRRALVDPYNTSAIATYPKEQYGKKEFYILIIKLPQIVDDIFEDGVKLTKFIRTIGESHKAPIYLGSLRKAIDDGYLIDKGVISDMYKQFKESDEFRGQMNKLEMDIFESLIVPYLEDNGLMSVRHPMVEDPPEEDDDEEDTEE